MHFKRRCKVWICLVILGHVESFRILQELQYFFYEGWHFSSLHQMFESENFRFPFSSKYSLNWGVNVKS